MKSRAIRRHHREHLKHRITDYRPEFKDNLRLIGILANTPSPCSCWMCSNPRKYYKESTFQERRMRQESLSFLLEEAISQRQKAPYLFEL